MKDQLELAYLAGVMDSDGFISIRRHSTNPRFADSQTFSEFIGVGQTRPEAVEMFAARWSGQINVRKRPENDNWKPIYYWTVSCKLAARCIADLRPFLRIKARQADLLLSIRATKNIPLKESRTVVSGIRARGLSPEIIGLRVAAWEEVRSLNDSRKR